MKGKVTCTCGWSWNKSDSSKKDMYICHECGRDNSNNMKNGGWLDSYDKAQDGKDVTPSQDETSFAKDYMSSPAYYNMLKKSSEKSGEDMNMLSAMRNINLRNTSVAFPEKNTSSTPGATAESNSDTGEINVYPEALNSPFLKGIIQHEISHSVDRPIYPGGERLIPKSDIDLISKYSNSDKNFLFTSPEFKDAKYDALRNNYRYISEPTETRARLNDIRYNAKSSKLYDPFTEKVTPEILKKIKNSKTTDAFDDLNSIYNDDQIINLLNSVSQNEQFQKESFVAKNGGWLDRYADGGTMQEHQENYNDYKVSAPKDFKGNGYSNVGRNYSPAWGGQFEQGGYIPQAQTVVSNIFGNMMGGRNTSQYEMYGDDQAGGLNTFNPHYTRPAKTQTVAPQQEVAQRPFSDYRSVNAMPVNYNQHAISMRDRQFLGEMPMRGETLMSMRGPSWVDPPRYRDEYDVEPRHTEWRSDSRFDMIPLSIPNPAGPTRFTEYPSAKLPTIRQSETKDGKQSWNIRQKNTRMKGKGGSYDEMDVDTTDPEQVKRAIKKAEEYNAYTKKKYGNSKNPKAIERLNTLRNDVEITPQYQVGGSIPGAVGFTYARTNDPAPSEGPYAKKTMASAKTGKVIKDDRGQWDHPGEITEINSPYITMQGVPYDVLGISDTGDTKLMKPGKNYKFKGKKVTEFPMAKNGLRQEQKGLVNLDNLLNFTNYNKPQPGGWLSKYE